MSYPSIFDSATTEQALGRLEKLSNESQPQWGKMNVAQMLAHLNVSYDQSLGVAPPKYGFFMKLILKMIVKNKVVGPKPYGKNLRTAPSFLISDSRDFEKEKARLIENIKTVERKGKKYFDGKESAAFGKLSIEQWNNLFYKHMDHHFSQFGI